VKPGRFDMPTFRVGPGKQGDPALIGEGAGAGDFVSKGVLSVHLIWDLGFGSNNDVVVALLKFADCNGKAGVTSVPDVQSAQYEAGGPSRGSGGGMERVSAMVDRVSERNWHGVVRLVLSGDGQTRTVVNLRKEK
jgi:hypothetical protein